MNGFEKRAQIKKYKILQAVIELYSEREMEKVSIAEIAQKACVSQVTIYKYFESKDNLTYCAIEYYYSKLLQSFIDVINRDLPFEEKIKQAFFEPMEKSRKMSDFWDSAMSSKFRDITIDYEQKLIPHLLRFIDQGVKSGYFSKSYSTETLLFYLSVFGESTKKLESITDQHQKERLYEDLLSLFLHGVSGADQREA